MLHHQHSGVSVMVNPGRYGANILASINGKKSFADLFNSFRADWKGQAAAPDDATLFTDFAGTYNTLNALERLLLRLPDSLSSYSCSALRCILADNPVTKNPSSSTL
jgi:hypothetical protein